MAISHGGMVLYALNTPRAYTVKQSTLLRDPTGEGRFVVQAGEKHVKGAALRLAPPLSNSWDSAGCRLLDHKKIQISMKSENHFSRSARGNHWLSIIAAQSMINIVYSILLPSMLSTPATTPLHRIMFYRLASGLPSTPGFEDHS